MDAKQLTEIIAQDTSLGKEDVQQLIDSLGVVISKAALEMDSVIISGFGAFEPRKRLERVAAQPSSGKMFLLPPKLLLGFRPSALLKQRVK
ncbi:MAG: HU family DNA-binding protein [Bacteroidales bacterium]|nr:HU family DNA-binding protein [Bacteroidales bacterium]MBD5211815.1 HU family DNA-binding protein [Bacteroidales bacterium]MBD5216933.1 HU family DNA-binding protein [Bacteroidales bacterium]MBD5221902.1 HU family DNA-binding protein [Bacteroidales bacterium]